MLKLIPKKMFSGRACPPEGRTKAQIPPVQDCRVFNTSVRMVLSTDSVIKR